MQLGRETSADHLHSRRKGNGNKGPKTKGAQNSADSPTTIRRVAALGAHDQWLDVAQLEAKVYADNCSVEGEDKNSTRLGAEITSARAQLRRSGGARRLVDTEGTSNWQQLDV